MSCSCKSQQTFMCSFVRRRSTNFATTHFIIKPSIELHWHELRDTPVISEVSSLVRQRFARTAWWTFWTFSSVLLVEGWPQLSWFSTDISPLLKWTDYSYTCVVLITSSLKASLSIVTCFSCSFSQKETKFHTRLLFKISHLNFLKITKHSCRQ